MVPKLLDAPPSSLYLVVPYRSFQADFIFLTHTWLSLVLLPLHKVLTSCVMTLFCLSIPPPYLPLPQSSVKQYFLRKIFSHLQISQIDTVPLGNLISVVKLSSSVWWRKNSLPPDCKLHDGRQLCLCSVLYSQHLLLCVDRAKAAINTCLQSQRRWWWKQKNGTLPRSK